MVMAVLQIRSLGKILNPWYACNVAKNATLSDVYSEFSSGSLDQGMPLPEKYQTTAYIGQGARSAHKDKLLCTGS